MKSVTIPCPATAAARSRPAASSPGQAAADRLGRRVDGHDLPEPRYVQVRRLRFTDLGAGELPLSDVGGAEACLVAAIPRGRALRELRAASTSRVRGSTRNCRESLPGFRYRLSSRSRRGPWRGEADRRSDSAARSRAARAGPAWP